MNNLNKWILLATVTMLLYCPLSAQKSTTQLVDYIDPFIGVLDERSSCVIGPQLPFASINPSPQTPKGQMDGYAPDQAIRGFGQLHVSGTGWGKYGQIFISPQVGLAIGETEHDSPKEDERAKAYEYAVTLSRYGIRTEVTPSFHSAIYKFGFPKTDSANIVFDLTHHLKDIVPNLNGRVLDGSLTITGSTATEIKGYGNYNAGWNGVAYRVYFCLRLNKKPARFGTWINGEITSGKVSEKLHKTDDRVGAFFGYKTTEKESIYLKVGVSFKSIEQATYWLNKEIPDWDYNKVRNTARQVWNNQLNKIVVEGGDDRDKKIFYTAFYHTYSMPRDRTNDMEGFNAGVPVWDDHFCVWDTWRTAYPLHALINPSMVAGSVNSFIARLKANGKVKDSYVAGKDLIKDQGGNNVDNVIADAYVKQIKGVDWKEAYKVMKFNADKERLGTSDWNLNDGSNTYKEMGYIPVGLMCNSLTLEYAYNDFCVAQLAKVYGTPEDYKNYLKRSESWRNVWNPDAVSDGFKGFVDSKRRDGTFVGIDLKKYPGSWHDHFYEGSSWDYSWFVPHQFPALVELCGGKELFAKKLQHGFDNNLINYGNEPAFLAVQAFHYAGRSDLASLNVRKLMKKRFNEKGYSGNDDSGAMSSWFMFSSMGFFPNAGQDIYYLTGSAFKKVTLKLADNKILTISAPNASPENIYVKSVTINGKKWNKPWFQHKDIVNGGTIFFDMTNTPAENWK